MNESIILEYLKLLSVEIKKERKKQNLLGKEAAKMVGLSSSRYSYLETNPKEKTSILKYSQMIEVLHVRLSSFLKRVYYIQKDLQDEISLEYEYSNVFNPEKVISEVFSEIKKERKSKGAPQRVIAEKIGIDRNYYSKIENGNRKRLSLYKLIEISEALEVPLYVLVERAELSLVEKAENNNI